MKKMRGFRLGRRLVRVFSWRITKGKMGCSNRAISSKLCKLGHMLKHGAKKGLCFAKHNWGYIRVGQEPKQVKGHLAVYVGVKGGDTCRVMVPVTYFNHPLFADLLREAEMEYGYNHWGGIQIPCRISKFEHVQSRIATSGRGVW